MLNKNNEAMRLFIENPFIKEKQMRQIFEADILEKDFKPTKYTNNLNF
jgi:hypothetical protein